MSLDETQIIDCLRRYVPHSPQFSFDFKDDCALLPPTSSRLLLSTDALIEGTHFRRAWMPAEDLSYKALAVNLSDLASKGAMPHGFMLSWGLPTDIESSWVEDFARGLGAVARRYGCPLLGGNTSRSTAGLFVSVTIFGEAPEGRLKSRMLGQPGDWICVTGTLGAASAGLEILEAGQLVPAVLVGAHRRPEPRLAEARWLVRHSAVHAMMDLSDGLRMDLPRLAAASKLGFKVQVPDLPVHADLSLYAESRGLSSRVYALAGGEDYELLLTIAPNEAPRILRQFAEEFDTGLTRIGKLRTEMLESWEGGPSTDELARVPAFRHFVD